MVDKELEPRVKTWYMTERMVQAGWNNLGRSIVLLTRGSGNVDI